MSIKYKQNIKPEFWIQPTIYQAYNNYNSTVTKYHHIIIIITIVIISKEDQPTETNFYHL